MPKVKKEEEYIDLDEFEEDEEELEDRGDDLDIYDEDDSNDNDDETEDDDDIIEDEDDEFDDEDEDDDDEDDDEDPKGSVDDSRIPRSRLNEVIAQREAERERSKWLEAQLEKLLNKSDTTEIKEVAPEVYDYEEAETKYAELLLEGETAKAAKLRREINSHMKSDMEYQFNTASTKAVKNAEENTSRAVEQARFDALVENYENKYSFLSQASDDYNPAAVEGINTYMQGLVASGKSMSSALKQAVEYLVPMYAPASKPTEKNSNRRKKAVKKNISAAKKQPAKPRRKKEDDMEFDDDIDIYKIPESKWKNMPEKLKRKLRGD